jgi:hypothetical protein
MEVDTKLTAETMCGGVRSGAKLTQLTLSVGAGVHFVNLTGASARWLIGGPSQLFGRLPMSNTGSQMKSYIARIMYDKLGVVAPVTVMKKFRNLQDYHSGNGRFNFIRVDFPFR